MSRTVAIRLNDELFSSIEAISKETERSKSFHIQKALEIYLDEIADLQIAFDRLKNVSDPIISLDEMRKELEL